MEKKKIIRLFDLVGPIKFTQAQVEKFKRYFSLRGYPHQRIIFEAEQLALKLDFFNMYEIQKELLSGEKYYELRLKFHIIKRMFLASALNAENNPPLQKYYLLLDESYSRPNADLLLAEAEREAINFVGCLKYADEEKRVLQRDEATAYRRFLQICLLFNNKICHTEQLAPLFEVLNPEYELLTL